MLFHQAKSGAGISSLIWRFLGMSHGEAFCETAAVKCENRYAQTADAFPLLSYFQGLSEQGGMGGRG